MSHRDSEIKELFKQRLRKQFKAKERITTEEFKKLKRKLGAIFPEMKLIRAVNVHDTEEVKKLLQCGVNPNTTDSQLRSVLHIAVSKGYADIVQILLRFGADPNKRDVIHNTPLHLAACVHNFSIIAMLINAKADVRSLDMHGRNPLQLARSKLEILQKGLRQGAIEMHKVVEELDQIVNLFLCVIMGIEETMEELHQPSVENLQFMKLSLNSGSPEEIDQQMSKLLNEIEKFKLS